MIKPSFYINKGANFHPPIVKRRDSISLEKQVSINNRSVSTRQVTYREKKKVEF
jgi:hypothetical protein